MEPDLGSPVQAAAAPQGALVLLGQSGPSTALVFLGGDTGTSDSSTLPLPELTARQLCL